MNITDICDFLYDVLPSTLKPKYVGEVPSATEEGVAISMNDGEDTIRFLGSPDIIEQPYVRFYIRTKSYPHGSDFSNIVKTTLNRYADDSAGILGMWMQGNVNYLGVTETKLHEFELLFKAMIRKE